MCEDAGIMYLHENCNNYGGMSWKHTLKLIENVKSPNFRLVFDTGNPVLNFDRSTGSDKLEVLQDSFEFYRNVREFIYYVHIKDAICEEADNVKGGFAKAKFTFPGEGNGRVKEIVKDLLKNGYDGGFSIEPHMVKVFHEEAADDNSVNTNYAEYGRRFMALVENAKAEIAAGI
jgi:sugar phosphate isomerase/epimerase